MKLLFFTLLLVVALACSQEAERRTDEPFSAPKDTAIFAWATELCDFQSTYNPTQYTKQQLENTHALWLDNWYLEAPAVATTPDELTSLNLDSLRRDYEQMREHLNKHTPVDVPFWQQLKQQRIRAMDSEYTLKKLAISAYQNPALLRKSKYDAVGSVYVEALISGDTTALLKAWKRLNEEQKKASGLPEKLEDAFQEKYKASDRLLFAKVELMAYGWWNHVRQSVPYVEVNQRMETEFKKLFNENKATCSEP
ncbi:hypothetical protein GCM10027592_36830 [Spirosoma flavus]